MGGLYLALYFGVVFLFGIRPLLLREFKIQVRFAEDVFHHADIVNNAWVFAARLFRLDENIPRGQKDLAANA